MKKVAILLLTLISIPVFSQVEFSINTDLRSIEDTCLRPFRTDRSVYVSVDYTDLSADTTELTIYMADWDRSSDSYVVEPAYIPGVTWPLVLSKAADPTYFDVTGDGLIDTTNVKAFTFKVYSATALCWKTTKQDSGTYVLRVTK